MLIPLANAIFDKDLNIEDYLKPKSNSKKFISFESLNFLKVDKKRFPIIKLKSRLNEHISTPIIINAANEILVDQFLTKKIKFNAIISNLYLILRDKNFKKYAIKKANSIQTIHKIDNWARDKTLRLIKK